MSATTWTENESVEYGNKALSAIEKVIRFKNGAEGKMFLLIVFRDAQWIEYVRQEFHFLPDIEPFEGIKFMNVPTFIQGNTLLVQIEDDFSAEKVHIISVVNKRSLNTIEKEFSIINKGENKVSVRQMSK